MRWRGKNVVNAASGKSTTLAPMVDALWRRVIMRWMVSPLFDVRWMGPIWAAAILSVRGMVAE